MIYTKKNIIDNFYLLSLIVYDYKIDIKVINDNILKYKNFENKYLKFDFVYKRNDEDIEFNKISIKSWDDIFKKYNIL